MSKTNSSPPMASWATSGSVVASGGSSTRHPASCPETPPNRLACAGVERQERRRGAADREQELPPAHPRSPGVALAFVACAADRPRTSGESGSGSYSALEQGPNDRQPGILVLPMQARASLPTHDRHASGRLGSSLTPWAGSLGRLPGPAPRAGSLAGAGEPGNLLEVPPVVLGDDAFAVRDPTTARWIDRPVHDRHWVLLGSGVEQRASPAREPASTSDVSPASSAPAHEPAGRSTPGWPIEHVVFLIRRTERSTTCSGRSRVRTASPTGTTEALVVG